MAKTLITTALALGPWSSQHPQLRRRQLHREWPSRLSRQAQHLVANGVQPGAWVVNGYGIAPAAERAAFTAPASTEASGQKCYYVLDVLLCD